MNTTKREPTIRDLITAVGVIKKFIDFGDRANKLLTALIKVGVDISRLNPYDFTSLIRLARAHRDEIVFDEEELMRLQNDFEDILDMSASEIYRHINVIKRFVSLHRTATNSISSITRQMGVSKEDFDLLSSLFGIKLPSAKKREATEEIEETEDAFSDEELEEIRRVIKKFKGDNV